jgi:hypothetical protein
MVSKRIDNEQNCSECLSVIKSVHNAFGPLECSGAKSAFGYGALSLVTELAAKNSSMLRGITEPKSK